MLIDSNIRDQAYQFFIQESMEFLQMLEEGLLNLQQEHDTPHIHAIMRAAHSIKGGAASVGLEAIKKIAHQMEDVLRALYKDTVVIDAELEELLLHAYDCLRTPLIQQIQTGENEGEKWLAQSEVIFEQLVERLGDAMLGESELPTAAELGIDIVQVIFSSDVEEGIKRLEKVLADPAHPEIGGELRAQCQVFLGLGELVNLPGFVAIANASVAALDAHPAEARSITQVAMDDFRMAQQLVLAGDRGRGGDPSTTLLAWTQAEVSTAAIAPDLAPIATPNPAADVAAVFASMAADLPMDDAPLTGPIGMSDDVPVEANFWAAALGQDDDDDSFALDVFDALAIDAVDADSFIDLDHPEPQYFPDDSLQAMSFDLSEGDDDDDDDASMDFSLADLTELEIPAAALPESDPAPSIDTSMRQIQQAETTMESWDGMSGILGLDDNDDDAEEFDVLGALLINAELDAVPDTEIDLLDDATDDQAPTVSFDLNSELAADLSASLGLDEAIDDSDDAIDLDFASDMAIVAEPIEFVIESDQAMEIAPEAEIAAEVDAEADRDADYAGLSDMMTDLSGSDTDDDEEDDWPSAFMVTEPIAEPVAAIVAEPIAPAVAESVTPTVAPIIPTVIAPVTAPAVATTPPAMPTRSQMPIEEASRATIAIDLNQAPAVPVKPQTAQTAASADAPMLSNAIRVDLDRLDRLNNLVGEMVSQENSSILQNQQLMEILTTMLQRVGRFDHLTRELRTYLDGSQTAHSHMPKTSSSTTIAAQSNLVSEFDPLQMDNYSDLSVVMQETIDEIAQIGEAMRDMTLLTRNAQQTQRHKQQTLREVRTDLLWARMLPIGDILQRFPRMIRDMSRKHGKSIAVKLSGNATLVDKSMLERLYDPLVHLVRNAFDHGIEPIEQRAELGKSAEATIDIRAYHRGSQIYIEVQDDGRGIDVDRVLKKAIAKELVTPEAAAKLTKEEIYELLFAPGFSTVDIVSELSGRGVGLDTVISQIKLLKGSLSIASEMGKGTTFTIRLPLTLTITKLLVFTIGGRLMSVPVDSLRAIVAAPVDQIQTLKNGQFYHWQEQFIPIYPQTIFSKHYALTHQLQEQPNALTLPTKGKVPLLMLAGENQTIALPVETILYERELAIKPFSNAVTPPPYLYGCTLLGDGSLVPVLDAQILISAKQGEIVTRRAEIIPAKPVVDINNATILVVDDSLTTRQTLAAVLQKAGYRVLQAKDGREGIEQLAQHAEIQAVFCDIEMPRMNGFEFLNSCRQDYAKEVLPVMMLSSRSNEKHRQVARYMGANEYLTKPFLEPELLEVLNNLLLLRAAAITTAGQVPLPALV
jgi:two-component system, chemotaxis family, sensor histidine kinase and response regulator PixL